MHDYDRAVTELENCVLCVIWQGGPLTAYEIAKPFVTSQSTYWSGSAGAIYPLVKRLEEKGLVVGATADWNTRQKRTFTLSPAGLEALRAWLAPPFEPSVGAVSFDPVRTRMSFLGALQPRARKRFLDDAKRVVGERLADLEKLYEEEREAEKTFDALATRGGIYELRARLAWLETVREELL